MDLRQQVPAAQNQQRLTTGLQRTPIHNSLQMRVIDELQRIVELSYSSETPVQRWYGNEILCHDPGACDLTRLNNGGVLLFNHVSGSVLGRILEARVDPDRIGRAKVQFDHDEKFDPDTERIWNKVKTGTLKCTSVQYGVDSWEEVRAGAKSSNGRFAGPADVALRWWPAEVSIVSVPADPSVGVGRAVTVDDALRGKRARELQLIKLRGGRL